MGKRKGKRDEKMAYMKDRENMKDKEDKENTQNTDSAEDTRVPGDEEKSEEEAASANPEGADGENPDEAEGYETDSADGSSEDGDADAEDGSGEDAEADGAAKKDSHFKKKKKDKRDEQIDELTDKLRRQMAEFENFRKRSEKEKAQMFDMGARSIIEKVLPVVDNFERGLAAVPEEQKDDAFVDGMDKVYRQLLTELDAAGVKPIEAEGKEFDPEFHNAVMQVEDENLEAGTVAQELQKGYTYKDTVVRHSMVSVVQ